LKKRSKKLLLQRCRCAPPNRRNLLDPARNQTDKSFLVLFFKKRTFFLWFCLRAAMVQDAAQ
jgi:hypothetical protein